MTIHCAIVRETHVGMRLDAFLTHRFDRSIDSSPISERTPQQDEGDPGAPKFAPAAPFTSFSRSTVQRMISLGQVTVNGRRAKASARLKLQDRVEVQWLPPVAAKIAPEPLEVPILYEDEDLIIVNKPPGMVVHPAAGNPRGTLVNALLHHCPNLQGIGGERRPGIVHRLDKDTSGVMVVAKHQSSFHHLALQFKNRGVTKEYAAIVWGQMAGTKGIIDRPIGRHRSDRKRMSSLHSLSRSRSAVTEWEMENSFGLPSNQGPLIWITWLRVRPQTGRTHQIRVHLADEGFPVVKDQVYGRRKRVAPRKEALEIPGVVNFPRQALHAERLRLIHPRMGVEVEFVAPWFEDMRGLLNLLNKRCVEKLAEKEYRG